MSQTKPKVVGIGFHKIGTKSLAGALRQLGYRVTGPVVVSAWEISMALLTSNIPIIGIRRAKRTYSLRTMKPSTNTLVTLHRDGAPGGLLGGLVNTFALRTALETAMKTKLENVDRNRPRSTWVRY